MAAMKAIHTIEKKTKAAVKKQYTKARSSSQSTVAPPEATRSETEVKPEASSLAIVVKGDRSKLPDTQRELKKEKEKEKDEPKDKKEEVWKYEGEVNSDGKYHGIGKLSNINTGEFYEGQWVNGTRDGYGKQEFPTGEFYQGAWKNDLMDGQGVVSYNSGDKFEGLWEAGKRVSGSFAFGGGKIKYKDKWVDDAPAPIGTLEFNTGGRYVGEVSYNTVGRNVIKNYLIFRQGYGEMYWSNNSKYKGKWKNDKCKGYGVFLETNGSKYYGSFSRGKKSGYGVHMFNDGTYYEGGFHHDEKKGKGKICAPNGDIVLGEWADAKVSNAVYHPRKFTDVPRPLRAVFLANIMSVQKTEDKALFTSSDKWLEFVRDALQLITPENCDLAKITTSISTEGETSNNLTAKFGLQPLVDLVDRFIYLFNWEYEKAKGNTKKEWTYLLSTAVDDVNSFIACLSINLAEKLNLDYKRNKQLYEVLISKIFPKIYKSLFPLYQAVNKTAESFIRSKVVELRSITPALIGVKSRFHLQPVPDEHSDEDEHTNGVRRPFPPKPTAKSSPVIAVDMNAESSDSDRNSTSSSTSSTTNTAPSSPARLPGGRGVALRGRGRVSSSRHSVQLPPKPDDHSEDGSEALSSSGGAQVHGRGRGLYMRRKSQPRQDNRISTSREESPSKQQQPPPPLPYQRVIDSLKKLRTSLTPIDKLVCLTKAAQGILECVDECNTDKTKQIVMGAEDKFPVLIYALIRANLPDVCSHCSFIQDFVTEHLGDEESKYRASELTDAIKYIRSLDWELRDVNNVLVPLKMIISAVGWSAKGVERIKFGPEVDAETARSDLQLILYSLFLQMGNRQNDSYSPLEIPSEYQSVVESHENFFSSVFSGKEVGLKLRKERATTNTPKDRNSIFFIDFEIRHPLYVYTKLAEAVIAPEPD